MGLNIVNFIKKMLPIFRKSDAVVDLETSLESIETTVLPSFHMLEEIYKTSKPVSEEAKKITKVFYENMSDKKSDFKLSNSKVLAVDVTNAFKAILVNGNTIRNELDKATSDAVVSESLSAFKAFLFRSVAHYSFMSKYASDLSNYIFISEAVYANKDLDSNYSINKKQETNVISNMWIFARLVSFYGQSAKQFEDSMSDIPDIILPKDKLDEVVDVYTAAKIEPLSNLPEGFIGSPIYSIRLVFAQWQSDRYKEFKDKKKLMELRCLHLKMLQEQGESDVNLEKEIAYLQRRVSGLDYKITKIEEDLDA